VASERSESGMIPALAAIVPLLLAALCDPEARDARDVVVGLTMASDRSLSIPLAQLLSPLSALIPIGPIELRAAIALAIPAALATFLVARAIESATIASRARGGSAIAFAFAATVGVLLGGAPVAVSLAVIAIELLRDARATRSARAAALLIACWGAPRLAPAVIVALWLMRERDDRSNPILGAVPVLAMTTVLMSLRREAWLSFGHPLRAPSFARAAEIFPSGAMLRAAIVLVVLGVLTRIFAASRTAAERNAPIVAGVALLCSIVLGAPDGIVVAAACVAPLSVSFAGALSIAVERHLARAGRTALSLLIPALALGLGARAFEVHLAANRLGPALVAHDLAPLITLGTVPIRGVILMEDEGSLLRFAGARVVHGVRPDLQVLPAQSLAAGGAARMANQTIATIPAAADPLRALLARGVLDGSDIAPLAQKGAVLAELPAHRLRGVARHAAPTGGPLTIALERVDPSDRRLRRTALERRLAFLATALAARPPSDRLRTALRVSATREARVLSIAGDRDGALAAIARAAAFGADAERLNRWSARVNAKQTLENEPPTNDDGS
jgi:hypothetical protein